MRRHARWVIIYRDNPRGMFRAHARLFLDKDRAQAHIDLNKAMMHDAFVHWLDMPEKGDNNDRR